MTRILLLNSGPHSDVSHGYRLAMEAIAASGIDHVQITERDLVQSPIPPIGRDYAIAITSQTATDAKEFDWSERLIVELEQHDMLFIVTPMHNFTVPAALKLWIDHVIRIHRSFRSTPQGKIQLRALGDTQLMKKCAVCDAHGAMPVAMRACRAGG